MAVLHHADLRPSKLELIAAWLPAQPWFVGERDQLRPLGAYRFDDPDGEVGLETHIVRSGRGSTLQVPLSYRAVPLVGGDARLVGTLMHSVLGRRWVYDACGDPVYATVLAATILGGGTQADEYFADDGPRMSRAPTVSVIGSGSPSDAAPVPVRELTCSTRGAVTVINAPGLELAVSRVLELGARAREAGEAAQDAPLDTLTGTWAEAGGSVLLATARRT